MLVTSDSSHLKESPETVQVKVTVSIGHGLSSLTEYWAIKEKDHLSFIMYRRLVTLNY